MADPGTWALAATAVSAASSIAGGLSQASGMRAQAKAAEYEARIADLRGMQVSAQRRMELNEALGAIDTIRAGRGVAADSATGRAIRQDRRVKSRDAENIEVLSERLAGMSKRNEAAGLRSGAKWARIQGFARAASTGLQGFGDFQSARDG